MFCKFAPNLSGKDVAKHLNNGTAKAYLHNQDDAVSLFFQVWFAALLIWLTSMVYLSPAYIPTHPNVETDYLSYGRLVLKWYVFPCVAQAAL